MKTLFNVVTSVALSCGAGLAFADEQRESELSACQSELQAHYGADTPLSLVDKRRNVYGTQLRMAARMDADNTRFATCWIPRDSGQYLSESGTIPGTGSDVLVVVSR